MFSFCIWAFANLGFLSRKCSQTAVELIVVLIFSSDRESRLPSHARDHGKKTNGCVDCFVRRSTLTNRGFLVAYAFAKRKKKTTVELAISFVSMRRRLAVYLIACVAEGRHRRQLVDFVFVVCFPA